MENYYLIKNFEIFSKDNRSLFYTPEVSAYLKNPALIALLHRLRKERENKISLKWLQSQIEKYQLDDNIVRHYLENEIKVISRLQEERFQKVFLVCDDFEIKQTLKIYFKKAYSIEIFTETSESVIDDKTLILLFSSVYSSEFFQHYYSLAEEKSAWILSAYLANHFLVIDNIYQHKKGMPCHFCNFNRHEQLTLSANALKKTSWVNFCRRLMNENIQFFPAMNLSALERGACTFLVGKYIEKIH